MSEDKYKAYLRVRSFETREVVHSVGLTSLNENHVEKVMMGLLGRMDLDRYFIDDDEVIKAQEDAKKV